MIQFVCRGGDCYTSIQAAVNAAPSDGTGVIELMANVSVPAQVTIAKTLQINGNNHTISGAFAKPSGAAGNSNNSILSPSGTANTITLNNLVIDGTGSTDLHGINAYVSNVILNNVTIQNMQDMAININGSIVTATNIKTFNNATRALFGTYYSYNVIELGQGSGVTRVPSFTVLGVSQHNEVKGASKRNHIYVGAGTLSGNISSQYTQTGNNYNLKPVVAPLAPTITSPIQNQTITTPTGEVTIVWNAVTGAELYEVAIDGGAAVPVIGGGTDYTTTLAAGPHTVTVRSVGPAGLAGGTSAVRNFTIGINELPQATIITPAVNGYVRTKNPADLNKLVISGTFTDDQTANYLQLQLVGHNSGNPVGSFTFGSVFTTGGPFTYKLGVPANIVDGQYQLVYTPTDYDPITGGGQTATPGTVVFTIDNTRPQVELVSPADGTTNPANYVVKATDNFALKTVTGHVYNAAGTTLVKNCSQTATPATNEYLLDCATTGLTDGTYTIRYNASDMAGNLSTTKTSQFVIDRTAPVVTVDSVATSAATTRTITGTATDDNVVTGVEVSVDGGTTWQPAVLDGTDWTLTVTGLTVATHKVIARATDEAGNRSSDDTTEAAPYWTTFAVQTAASNSGVPETPVITEEDAAPTDDTTNFIAFLPGTIGGIGSNNGPATPLLTTPATNNNNSNDTEVLGAEDTRASWSVVNAALAGFIAILAIVALAGIRRKETDNNTVARVFTIVPAAAAVIAFFMIENLSGSIGWFNVWTWLFAGILVVQAIVATLTTRTAND